jgi:hypothetical protein
LSVGGCLRISATKKVLKVRFSAPEPESFSVCSLVAEYGGVGNCRTDAKARKEKRPAG